ISHKARLSKPAKEARRLLHNRIEQLMRDGGAMDDVRDIASKSISQVCKVALILHLAKDPDLLKTDFTALNCLFFDLYPAWCVD
ncbi:MAG: DUF3987 domain-containing protein, partial [bacterium]